MDTKTLINQYVSIVQKIARVEQRRIPNHMIEYEELVSIGIIAVQTLIKDKTEEQLARYNEAYIGTAVKWAIRNELRHRYKWYTLKHKQEGETESADEYSNEQSSQDTDEDMGFSISPTKVREAVYETILSIDGLAAAATDNASPFDFLKDPSAMPDEQAEIVEMSRIKFFDATLRDGSHAIKHQLKRETIESYCKAMDKAGMQIHGASISTRT